MGYVFYGHAAVFGYPDKDRDIMCPGAFTDFLASGKHLEIPMLNNHQPDLVIGRWIRMHQDGFGLFVIGEVNGGLAEPFSGISIGPLNAQGSPNPNTFGGKLVRSCALSEISLVAEPAHPACRILGPW